MSQIPDLLVRGDNNFYSAINTNIHDLPTPIRIPNDTLQDPFGRDTFANFTSEQMQALIGKNGSILISPFDNETSTFGLQRIYGSIATGLQIAFLIVYSGKSPQIALDPLRVEFINDQNLAHLTVTLKSMFPRLAIPPRSLR